MPSEVHSDSDNAECYFAADSAELEKAPDGACVH
jgi:hypothetical protein